MKGNRWRGGPGRPPAPGICVSNDSLGDITPTNARQGFAILWVACRCRVLPLRARILAALAGLEGER
jgi:hypothetical protein